MSFSIGRGPRLVVASALVAVTGLSACSSGGKDAGGGSSSTGGPVTITVAMDKGLTKEAKDVIDTRVKEFKQANPDVTVKTQEYTWTGSTFTADLAGGTLPDVFTVPFTDGRGLIQRQQIADVSSLVSKLPYAQKFNQDIAKQGEDQSGKMWAVPIAAYGQGIHYNRDLFTKAGLDPNKPPTTWEEVRADAKQISDKTGQAGYAQMTKDNTGGWILSTVAYSLGGRGETVDGDKTTATVNSPAYQKALQTIQTMRWQDNSMGSNFLYDWAGLHSDFAAGKVGMFISGGGDYGNLVTQNSMKPSMYGLAALPMSGDNAAILGGGTLAAVSAKASSAQQAAAVKWIDFYYLGKLTNKAAAQADAKATAASGQPVGAPQLPIFDKATYDEQQSWIKPYIDVPLQQFTPYTDKVFSQPLAAEPPKDTQDLYGKLDPVVQAVLTQKDADINQLLGGAQQQIQSQLDQP